MRKLKLSGVTWIFAFAFVLTGMFFTVPTVVVDAAEGDIVEQGQFGDNAYWKFDSNGVLTISGTGGIYGNNLSATEGTIPWKPYTEQIEEIVIEEGITDIGSYLFCYQYNIKKLTLADSVINIYDNAFSSCYLLTDIYYTPTACNIYPNAFDNSFQATLHCDENSPICSYAKQQGHSYQINGDNVVYGYIENGLQWDLNLDNNILNIQGSGEIPDYQSISIGGGGGDYFFVDEPWYNYRKEIRVVNIGDDITSIGIRAFAYQEALENVEIGVNVNDISDIAFQNCTSLVSFDVDEGNNYYSSFEDALYNKEKTKLISYPKNKEYVTLSDNLEIIGSYAFEECSKIKEIILPETVTEIEDYAFYFLYGENVLEKVFLPKSLVKIGEIPFCGCYDVIFVVEPYSCAQQFVIENWYNFKLSDSYNAYKDGDFIIKNGILLGYEGEEFIVDIPENVTEIGNYAFARCYDIEKVNIHNNVTKICRGAFFNCYNLEEIKILNDSCEIYEDENTISDSAKMYVYKDSSAENYAKKYNREYILIDDNEESYIPEQPSTESPAPTSPSPSNPQPSTQTPAQQNPSIPTTTEKVSAGATVTDVKSKSVYKVAGNATSGYTVTYVRPTSKKAKSVTIPATVTVNGVPCKVTSIANNAFRGQKKLKKVTIGANVTTIGKKAFSGCKNLTKIVVKSKKLKKVGAKAFAKINPKAKIKVPKNKKKAYKKVFKKNTGVKASMW